MKGAAVVGALYLIAVSALFISGKPTSAAYLTMPSWLVVVGALSAYRVPGSAIDAALASRSVNLVLLVLSAAINAAAVYAIVRLILRRYEAPIASAFKRFIDTDGEPQ